MLALLPLLILLCFGYPTQIGVLGGPVITTRPGASDQNPPLYMIFFKDDATKTEKEHYAKALEKAVSAERMGSIPLDEQNFILGALLTDSQLTAWNKSPVSQRKIPLYGPLQRRGTYDKSMPYIYRSRRSSETPPLSNKTIPTFNPSYRPESYTAINSP